MNGFNPVALAQIEIAAGVARAQIRRAAMEAENQHRLLTTGGISYGEDAFLAVIDEEGIGLEQIRRRLHDAGKELEIMEKKAREESRKSG